LMIERDTPERGPQSNADPRRSVNWTEFAPKDLPRIYPVRITL
jgi:hypothetical protein